MNHYKTWILILFVSTQFILQAQWLSWFLFKLAYWEPWLFHLLLFNRLVMSNSLWTHGLYSARLHHPWNFPGKDTGVGCHFLLQGVFPIQGLNLGLPYCRHTLYPLSHQGSPNLFHFLFWTIFSADRFQTPWSHLAKGSVQGSGGSSGFLALPTWKWD